MSKPTSKNRGKPKNSRAGCLMCKQWKVNGYPTEKAEGERWSDHKRRTFAKNDISMKE